MDISTRFRRSIAAPFPTPRVPIATALLVLALVMPPRAGAQEHVHPIGDVEAVGQVDFPTLCAPGVQADFNRAVAMLHSFWYHAAEQAFGEIVERDPRCAMAHWGVGMTRFHQLWERPTPEDMRVGNVALQAAGLLAALGDSVVSPREADFVKALAEIFGGRAEPDYLGRKLAYERRMEELHAANPEDTEATVFYALALLGTAAASPPDSTYARQRKARAILEGVLAQHPEHPGVTHYIIHASDFPALARGGLAAARRYAQIAPDAPHARHMPTHIFTRLGLWNESIQSNLAAAESARRQDWTGEELHASDYLTYAYLQRGRDVAARGIVASLSEMATRLSDTDPNYPAGIYALAAIPARYAVERREWAEAAALQAPEGWFPEDRYCWAKGTLRFANALGAVRMGDLQGARQAIADLRKCEAELRATGEAMWANRLLVDRRIVEAELMHADGDPDRALSVLRSAADLDDGSDKPPITPGSIVPARELLGELLLKLDRPAEALAAFQASLQNAPRRLHSLEGARAAAEAAGRDDLVEQYGAELRELTREAERE